MSAANNVQVGVLALQGGYAAHRQMIKELGVSAKLIRYPHELQELQGLIIPGGESTTLLTFLGDALSSAIINWYKNGGVILGTCAGAIVLANQVSPQQYSLNLMDIAIERNGYGRQLQSTVAQGSWLEDQTTVECVFIRAPRITRVGDGVNILVRYQEDPVAVEAHRCIVATYHPELTADIRLHQRFLARCQNNVL